MFCRVFLIVHEDFLLGLHEKVMWFMRRPLNETNVRFLNLCQTPIQAMIGDYNDMRTGEYGIHVLYLVDAGK